MGIGVSNPVIMANVCFDSSVCSTSFLRDSILGSATFELDAHISSIWSARQLDQKLQSQHYTATFDSLISSFNSIQQSAILRARDCNSAWLSVFFTRVSPL